MTDRIEVDIIETYGGEWYWRIILNDMEISSLNFHMEWGRYKTKHKAKLEFRKWIRSLEDIVLPSTRPIYNEIYA
jgi:hypothetical protein